MTALGKEYNKAIRARKKHHSHDTLQLAILSRLDYCKAIKRTKSFYLTDFPARITHQNIWTAKQYMAYGKAPRFPSLPGADTLAEISTAFLQHCFPRIHTFPTRGSLVPHSSTEALTEKEIQQALANVFYSSAPVVDGIRYGIWKRVNTLNLGIHLGLLAHLVLFGYHSPSLKHTTGEILDKPGKRIYDSTTFFRIMGVLIMVSKILERIVIAMLSALACPKGPLHPN